MLGNVIEIWNLWDGIWVVEMLDEIEVLGIGGMEDFEGY